MAHHLMASLTSVTSRYIEAQSNYIPLMNVDTCLSHLIESPSPICISCMKEQKSACSCSSGSIDRTVPGTASHGRRVGLTELELSLDSLNLTRGLSQMFGNWGWASKGRVPPPSETVSGSNVSSADDVPCHDTPTSTFFSSSSSGLWDNVCQLLSNLHRVAELYFAREAINEASHYAIEGMNLAKMLSLRYW